MKLKTYKSKHTFEWTAQEKRRENYPYSAYFSFFIRSFNHKHSECLNKAIALTLYHIEYKTNEYVIDASENKYQQQQQQQIGKPARKMRFIVSYFVCSAFGTFFSCLTLLHCSCSAVSRFGFCFSLLWFYFGSIRL